MSNKATVLPGWTAALLLCLTQPAAAASSYLHELEVEATRTDTTSDTSSDATTPDTASEPNSAALQGETLEAGLSKSEFEAVLEKSYYGSYLFYSTLNDGAQQRVYDAYKTDNRIDNIRDVIKEQLKN